MDLYEQYGYYGEDTIADSHRGSETDSVAAKRRRGEEDDGVDNFMTEDAFYNNVDGSISIVEKTSRKLLPIYRALLYKI